MKAVDHGVVCVQSYHTRSEGAVIDNASAI